MKPLQVISPYPQFFDHDGTALDNGFVYIGEINEDPETNPIIVYSDYSQTIPIAQPIRTLNGYPTADGSTPVNIYYGEEYSITVRDRKSALIYTNPTGFGYIPVINPATVFDDRYHQPSAQALRDAGIPDADTRLKTCRVYSEDGGVFKHVASSIYSDTGGAAGHFISDGGATSGWERIDIGIVTPEMFGAAGNGLAADDVAMQLMSDSLLDSHSVSLRGKYRLTQIVSVTSSASWKGESGSLIINDCTTVAGAGTIGNNIYCIYWHGSDPYYDSGLINDANEGDELIALNSVADVEVGDTVKIISNAILADTRTADITKGEWTTVIAIEGTSIRVGNLYDTYLIADGANIVLRKPIDGLKLYGLNILNNAGSFFEGITIRYFKNLLISDCTVSGGLRGIRAYDGYDVVFRDCTSMFVNEQFGYGLMFTHVTNGQVVRPKGHNNRHSVEISGTTKNTKVIDGDFSQDTSMSVSWHHGPDVCEVNGCVFRGGSDLISGVTMRGSRNKLINSEFHQEARVYIGEEASTNPITIARSGEDLVISDNKFYGPGDELRGKVRCLHRASNARIENNLVDLSGSGSELIFCQFVSNVDGLAFKNNEFKNGIPLAIGSFASFGIVGSDAASTDVNFIGNRGTILSNWIRDIGDSTDGLTWIDGLVIMDNDLTQTLGGNSIVENDDECAILGLKYINNNAEGGYDRLSDQIPNDSPSWGEIIAFGNTGDLSSKTSSVSGSTGAVQVVVPLGLQPIGLENCPEYIVSPRIAGSAVQDYYTRLRNINQGAGGQIQAIQYLVYDGTDTLAPDVTVTFTKVS